MVHLCREGPHQGLSHGLQTSRAHTQAVVAYQQGLARQKWH